MLKAASLHDVYHLPSERPEKGEERPSTPTQKALPRKQKIKAIIQDVPPLLLPGSEAPSPKATCGELVPTTEHDVEPNMTQDGFQDEERQQEQAKMIETGAKSQFCRIESLTPYPKLYSVVTANLLIRYANLVWLHRRKSKSCLSVLIFWF